MKHSRSRDLMLQMDRLVQLIQDSLNEELAQVLFHYRKRKLTAVCSHQTRIGNLDAHLI